MRPDVVRALAHIIRKLRSRNRVARNQANRARRDGRESDAEAWARLAQAHRTQVHELERVIQLLQDNDWLPIPFPTPEDLHD